MQAWCRTGHTALQQQQQQQQQKHLHNSTSSGRRSRQPPCTAAEAPKQQKTPSFQTVHMREAAPKPWPGAIPGCKGFRSDSSWLNTKQYLFFVCCLVPWCHLLLLELALSVLFQLPDNTTSFDAVCPC